MRSNARFFPVPPRTRGIIVVVAAALLAGGCSSGHSTAAAGHSAGGTGRPSPAGSARPRPQASRFTVTGTDPVEPNSSQDTHAQAAAACRPKVFRGDETLGQAAAAGFTAVNAPVAGELLAHFLAGTGTAIRFGPGSQIAREARASRVFRELNRNIRAVVLSQLHAERHHVVLAARVLTPVLFGVPGSSQDLYLGFRGTQGLDVRGGGTITRAGYSGTLTYVIRDSYGFPPQDKLLGVGTAMRYLQVNCGSPPHHGGARWFPDSITVTVPL